jgi:hypothetical protein
LNTIEATQYGETVQAPTHKVEGMAAHDRNRLREIALINRAVRIRFLVAMERGSRKIPINVSMTPRAIRIVEGAARRADISLAEYVRRIVDTSHRPAPARGPTGASPGH